MQMELNSEERHLLKNALDHYLLELTGEISSTDNRDFRQELKHEKEVLSVLMNRMKLE
jgi:hypothetical protein